MLYISFFNANDAKIIFKVSSPAATAFHSASDRDLLTFKMFEGKKLLLFLLMQMTQDFFLIIMLISGRKR